MPPNKNRRPRLLQPVASPPQFQPTQTWVDHDFIYRFDYNTNICKRSPIAGTSNSGTIFFSCVATETDIQPKHRPSQRRTGRLQVSALSLVATAALVVTVLPWVPEIQYQLSSHSDNVANAAPATKYQPLKPKTQPRPLPNNLTIPKIGVNTPIVEGPSLKILDKTEGVWHQTGDSATNLVLAGHRFRYLPPNTSTLYNLNKLRVGDQISTIWKGKQTNYRVVRLRTVSARNTGILTPTAKPYLTIYTCTDIRQTRRTVVVAEQI